MLPMKPQINSDEIPEIRTSLKEFNTQQGVGRPFAGRVPHSFQRVAYTANDKALRDKKSLATTDYASIIE